MPSPIALLGAAHSGRHALADALAPRLQSTGLRVEVIEDAAALAALQNPPLVLLLAPRDSAGEAQDLQWRERLMRNARDWEAFTISADPWPWLSAEDVAGLRIPALMLSADRTVPLHHFVDDLLARTLRHVERVRIPGASHDMWADQPERCRAATLDFLARHAA